MEAVQRDYWYSLALLTFLIILKASLQKSGDETVRLEDGMILDCLCPWDGNLSMVSWTKVPDRNPIAVYHPRFGANLAVGYNDRLEFLKRTSMDGSISFTNVTEEDAGLYHCSMQTFPLGTWTRDVQVVKENFLPHSKVTFQEGENVTLVCPRYNYSVSQVLIKKDDQEDIIGRCIQQSGPFVLKDQHETIRVSCADPNLGVTFELNNVVKEDEGRYRCLISTEYGVEIFTYEVTVLAQDRGFFPDIPEEYWIYIYAGAGATGLLLLLIIIILICCHRRKKRREAYRVKLHPGRRWRDSEQGGFYDRMRKGTRWGRQEPIYANVRTGQKYKYKPKQKRKR